MPSTTARQRNKRALDTTGSPKKPAVSRNKAKSETPRLHQLLYVLVATTVILLAYQLARFYYRGNYGSPHTPLSSWTKSKYGAADDSTRGTPFSPGNIKGGRKAFNKLAPEGAAPGQPALVPGQSQDSDLLEQIKAKLGSDGGELDAQFDDEGNLDMATVQRMLDILYKPARQGADGVKAAGKVAGNVLSAMVDDEVMDEAADNAEVEDESAP